MSKIQFILIGSSSEDELLHCIFRFFVVRRFSIDMFLQKIATVALPALGLAGFSIASADDSTAQWIAGDHHIHSRYSTGWDREQEPPAPILGGGDGSIVLERMLDTKNFRGCVVLISSL